MQQHQLAQQEVFMMQHKEEVLWQQRQQQPQAQFQSLNWQQEQ
jgi:hypothetical protein